MFSRIVVPLDGSELAERALVEAKELARMTGASVHLVRALDTSYLALLAGYPVNGSFIEVTELQQSLEDDKVAAEHYLAEKRGELTTRNLTVTTDLFAGDPADGILAATRPGDLIVMATHGRGGVARWFLGSVAEDVARRSAAPVMLIRTGPVAAETAVVAPAEIVPLASLAMSASFGTT